MKRRRCRDEEVIHLDPEEVYVGGRLRHLDEGRVQELMESAKVIGIKQPITYRYVEEMVIADTVTKGVRVLVAGLHRLEAARRLGIDVPGLELDGDEIDAELWELSENLHRAELSALDRADHIARWLELVAQRLPAQSAPAVLQDGRRAGPQHAAGGINRASRELGLERTDIQRAVKVASITPEAKAAARETGLADNRSALLKATKAPAEQQVAVIREIAAAKARQADQAPARPQFTIAKRPVEKTDLQWKLYNDLAETIERHLGAEFPSPDPGGVREILDEIAAAIEKGEITGEAYRPKVAS